MLIMSLSVSNVCVFASIFFADLSVILGMSIIGYFSQLLFIGSNADCINSYKVLQNLVIRDKFIYVESGLWRRKG